jgi:hypothetical protein
MKIGKYEFESQEQALEYINGLGVTTDEEGKEIPDHENVVVKIGNICSVPAEYDEEGKITKEAVYSTKYSVDVLWKEDQPADWEAFNIHIQGNGIHKFLGHDLR